MAPNRPIHNGIDATATAASPDDTVCSASTTMPLPISSSNAPITSRFFHCARVGAATPRQRRNRNITRPAATKRLPDTISNGGNPPSSAKRMPR